MNEAKREYVQDWLVKAASDLAVARLIEKEAEPEVRVNARYHCQQAAEKALKGFLTFFDQPVGKTHDIVALIKQAAKIEPPFQTWSIAGSILFAARRSIAIPEPLNHPTTKIMPKLWITPRLSSKQVLAYLPADVHPGPLDKRDS